MTALLNGSAGRTTDDPAASTAGSPETVQDLAAAATRLATDLPSPPHRIALRSGDVAVEVEFARAAAPVAPVAPAGPPAAEPVEPVEPVERAGANVRAPLVGTFFVAPAPGEPSFVKVGDRVEVGQTVGLIEAMKLMNAVVSDVAGTVLAVLVGDAAPVEYDQPLVRVGEA